MDLFIKRRGLLLSMTLIIPSFQMPLNAEPEKSNGNSVSISVDQIYQISPTTDEPIPPSPIISDYAPAYQAYSNGRLGAGIGPFQTFIASNPNATTKAEAQFWLGKSFADSGQPLTAMQAYFESFKTDPQGRYAPLALLNLGNLLYEADKVADACLVWDKIETDFDRADLASIRLVGADRRQRFDCPNTLTNARAEQIKSSLGINGNPDVVGQQTVAAADPVPVSRLSSMDVYQGERCPQYPVEPVGRSGLVNLYVSNDVDLGNRELVYGLGVANLEAALAQSSARCQGGIVFKFIHVKNAGKCPAAVGDGNSSHECLRQNDVDFSTLHIQAPRNRYSLAASNFDFRPGATTQAAIWENERLRKQAALDAKATAAALAESQRNVNIATFKRNAATTLTSTSRGYGTLAIDRMVEACFPNYAKEAVCKDFVITLAQFRAPNRADAANGITAIVDVKANALSKIDLKSQWKEKCSHNTFIRVNNGPWKQSTSYRCEPF